MIKFIERYRQKKGTDLLQKALSHKYIRRYPKKNGKGYNYVYTDSWKHPFKFLLSVFGLSKEKVVDSYEKNDIQKKYGADKKTWAGHILEYFTNRAKWDGFFSKKENRDGAKKPVKQSVVKAENEEKAKKLQAENKTKAVVNKDKMPINHSLMRKVWSLYSEQGKQVAKEENKVETTKIESVNIINKETNDYGKRSNDFRDLQRECKELSTQFVEDMHSGNRQVDEALRRRLSNVLGGEVATWVSSTGNGNGLLENTGDFKIHKNIDGDLFHDCFEIARNYLKFGECVDLHKDYKDCKCYLSDDGLSGFAITEKGDLVSVFNLSNKKGFLRSVSSFVKENAKTLDCYVLKNENSTLQQLYEKAFNFKTASIQDFNEEFDHDNIGKNHDKPQIAFMVMTNSDVETKHFDKDSYNKAKEYQMSIIRESEAEKHQNRSEAMQGNENAKKDGVEVEIDENTRKKNNLRDLLKRVYPNDFDRQLELKAMARSAGTRGRIAREVYKEDYGEAVKQRFDPKAERRRRIKAGEKSFNGLKDVLTTNKARTVVNEKLGKVYIEAGETGKSGYGLKHIIEQRYVKDGKTLDETTAICWLVADTVKNGTITRENGRTIEIQNGGIVAIVRKESDDKNAKWVLTGFANSDEEKEATDSIKSVIDDYRYSVEFSSFRTQVGAVISSINNVEQEKPKVNETPKAEVDTTTPVGKTSLGENIVNSISTDKATKIPMAKVESIDNGKVIFKATPQFKKCLKQLDSFKSKDEAKKLMTYVSIADGNLYSTDGRTVMRVKLDGAENLFGAYTYTVDNDKVVFSKVDGINELLPYERVIPNYSGEKTATINNKALLEKISSMRKEGALGDKKYQKIALEFKNGKCFVDGVEVGNAPNMENGFVCYHAKYLERALKNSDTSVLNFSDLKDGLKRAVSISTNVSDVVIMPMNDDGVVPNYEANRAEYAERNGKLNIQQSLDEETKNKNKEMLLDGNKENLKEEELSSLGNYSDQKILNILKVKDLNLEDLSNKCDLTSYESEKYFKNNFGMNSTMVSVIYSCLKEPKFQEAIKKEALNRNLIDETKARMMFEVGGNSSDEHNNRSEAMKGNQNAKKPFSEMSQEEKTEKAERIKNNVVASVKADSVPYNENQSVASLAKEWIKNNPQGDANTVIGDVLINEKSAIHDLHHGSKEDSYLKLQTLPAVKDVLEKGTYLGFEKDFDDKPIDNHYFAGKVKYGNEEKIVFCRVRENAGDKNRFYVHEVFTEDELKNEATKRTSSPSSLRLTGKPLFKYILQDVLNVKEDKNEDTSELEKIKNWKAPENLGELVNDKNFQCHFHNNFLRVSSLVGNDFGKVYTNIERFSSFSKEDKAKVGLYAIGLGYKFDDMENSFKYKGRYYLVVKGEGDRHINGMSYPNSDKIVCLNDLYDIQQLKEKVEKLSEKGFSRNDVVTKIQDAEEGIRLTEKTIARYKKAGFDYSNEEKELEEYKNALKDWKDISKRMYLVEQAEQGIYPTHSEESEEQNTKNDNLSEAMKGNQNAKKEFTQADKEAVLKTLNNPTEKMLKVEYSREEYNRLFPRGEVDTPIGKVKLGEHQFERLGEKDGGARKQFLGLLSQTLKNPDVIIDEVDNQNRNAKVWIKTVVDEDRAFRKRYYVAITPTIDGLDVVVSNGEREHKQIEDKIKMASSFYYHNVVESGSPTARTELNSLPSGYDNTPKAENVNNNADVVTPKFEIDKDKVSQINDISMSGKQGNSYQHDLDVSIEDFKKQFDVSKMNERQKEYFQERLNDYGKFAYESYNDMANKRIKAGPSWAVAGRGNYNSKHFDTGMDAEMNAFKTYRERQEKFIKNTKNHLDELRYDSNSESLETEKQKVFNDYASGKWSDSAIENTDPFAIEKISGHIKFLEDVHAVTLALYKKIKQNGTSMFELEYQDKNKDLKEKIYKELREEFKVKGMSIGAIKDGINHPFTSNQTANIRRYKERLEQLKKRQQVIDERKGKGSESSSNTGKVNFKGGYVYENPEIDRIQIFYDGIPSAEVRSKLKSNGFRWSPSQKAWQRQLNRNGRYAVNRVFKETGIDVELDTINGGVEVKKSLPAFAFRGNKFLIRKSVLKAFCG